VRRTGTGFSYLIIIHEATVSREKIRSDANDVICGAY